MLRQAAEQNQKDQEERLRTEELEKIKAQEEEDERLRKIYEAEKEY